ncbi:MAG: DNRLRE domain-containing protein [Fimbriimonadaceae bacterium]|nr:DNRLRE domain-containing protein [Fimbriimonadaceae bacterium]
MKGLTQSLAALAFMLFAGAAYADNPIELYPPGGTTVTFAATQDTRLQSHTPWLNDGNSILSTYMKVQNLQDTLIQFDVASLPANEGVIQATLRLYGMPWENAPETETHLFRATRPWAEYEAAWNFASFGNDWTNPGGDFVGRNGVQNADPFFTLRGPSTFGWYEFDATAIVRQWHTGFADNNGFLLAGPMSNRLVYVSREGRSEFPGYEANRPELVVRYGAVTEPGTMVGLGLIGLSALRRRRSV